MAAILLDIAWSHGGHFVRVRLKLRRPFCQTTPEVTAAMKWWWGGLERHYYRGYDIQPPPTCQTFERAVVVLLLAENKSHMYSGTSIYYIVGRCKNLLAYRYEFELTWSQKRVKNTVCLSYILSYLVFQFCGMFEVLSTSFVFLPGLHNTIDNPILLEFVGMCMFYSAKFNSKIMANPYTNFTPEFSTTPTDPLNYVTPPPLKQRSEERGYRELPPSPPESVILETTQANIAAEVRRLRSTFLAARLTG